MTREELETLKNNDIWWLAFCHMIAFAGPIGWTFLFIVWCIVLYRHGTRQSIVKESLEKLGE